MNQWINKINLSVSEINFKLAKYLHLGVDVAGCWDYQDPHNYTKNQNSLLTGNSNQTPIKQHHHCHSSFFILWFIAKCCFVTIGTILALVELYLYPQGHSNLLAKMRISETIFWTIIVISTKSCPQMLRNYNFTFIWLYKPHFIEQLRIPVTE